MTVGRRNSRTATDDSGVAAVVGAVILLALLATFYAHEARQALPEHAAAAERAWDEEASRFAAALAAGSARSEPARAMLPPAPAPEPVRVLLGAELRAPAPAGTVGIVPACGRIAASHVDAQGGAVVDIAEGPLGCVRVEIASRVGPGAVLRVENGGVVRVQGASAALVAPPSFDVEVVNGTHVRVRHVFPTFAGAAGGAGAGAAPLSVELVPATRAGEPPLPDRPNAREAAWTLHTSHPEAWRAAYEARLDAAGVPAGWYGIACEPAACAPDAATGLGRVTVTIRGPAADARADVAVAFSQPVHRVVVG